MSERKAEMLRRRAGYTSARKVAEELGIPASRLYDFEKKGAREAQLRLVDAIELSKLYACGLDELLDDDLAEGVTFSDKNEPPKVRPSILETNFIEYFRCIPPVRRLELYRDLYLRLGMPLYRYEDLAVEETVLESIKRNHRKGELGSLPNAGAIIDELIEEVKKEKQQEDSKHKKVRSRRRKSSRSKKAKP